MRVVRFAATLLVLTSLSSPLRSQGTAAGAPPRDLLIASAREIILAAKYATLVTVGTDGHPQARIVDAFAPDSAFTIWIATNPLSRKVQEIRREPRVTLLYFNQAKGEYVTVVGTAVIDADARQKAAHWKPEWARLYKNENRGDDYQLLRVTVLRLEVVSPARGINNDPRTWTPMSVTLRP